MNRIIRYISTVKSRPSAGLRAAGSIMAVCVAGFVALTLWGCQRKELQVQEYMAVVSIDNGVGTKGMLPDDENTPQINDIAIFAFSEEDDLVGYLYESELAQSRKTVFPMTLIRGGNIEFYVIANSAPGFFKVVSGDDSRDDVGTVLSRTSTANPPSYTKDDIQSFRVEIGNRDFGKFWYAPMANLATKENGSENRTFNVSSGTGYTKIPVEVSRAVSKVEVYLQDNDSENWSFNNCIQELNLESRGVYPTNMLDVEIQQGIELKFECTQKGQYNYDPYGDNTQYREIDYTKIWEYYIFPNTSGGNLAGNLIDGNEDACTILEIKYIYNGKNQNKKVYLPPCSRNECIRVWCNLGNDEDLSFTYTVSNWVFMEIDVPSFN